MEPILSLISSLDKPTEFLNPSKELKTKCVSILPRLFSITASCCTNEDIIQVNQLHSKGYDIEDVWQQIEIINDPLMNQAEGLNLDSLMRNKSVAVLRPELLINDNKELTSEEEEDHEDSAIEEDMEEESLSMDEDGEFDEEELSDTTTRANDQFFSLSEMESFVQQAERDALGDGKKNGDSDDESVDLFDVDAGEDIEFDSDNEGSDADNLEPEEGNQIYYKDFFDSVPKDSPDVPLVDAPLSKYQEKQKKLSEHIARLEARNLDEKPWQMSGEASSRKRNYNSLLQEDLMYDHVTCPAPDITEEVTIALEDIIKQRIIDKTWDDVIRKEKPKEKPFNYHLNKPLDQEKSKLSLAEVYEQEYLKQVQVDNQDKEDPRHEKIKKLMRKLFTELDALANFHFTPQVPEPEIKTMPNLPSITLEEVAPVTHSDAMLLAPEELQMRSKKIEIGQNERTATDRKRQRRQKKKFQHFRKEKIQRIKDKKDRTNKSTDKTFEAIKSSDKFFAQLSEKVKDHVKIQKRSNLKNSNSKHQRLRHLKL